MTAISTMAGRQYQRNPWRKGQMKRWLRDHAVIPGRANYRPCERKAKQQ